MGELIRGERKILRLVTEGTPRSQGFLVRCLPPSMDTRCHRSPRGTHQTDVMNQTTFPRELCGFGTICIVGTQKKCIPVEPKRLWGALLEEQEGRKAPLVCDQWDREGACPDGKSEKKRERGVRRLKEKDKVAEEKKEVLEETVQSSHYMVREERKEEKKKDW